MRNYNDDNDDDGDDGFPSQRLPAVNGLWQASAIKFTKIKN
jgi:hypothetical protein